MPVDKGKTNYVCPDCGGEKFRYSARCRECWAKSKITNPNSRWMKDKSKNPNHGKDVCPTCKKNLKTKNSIQCMECEHAQRLNKRKGKQLCVRCGSKLTSKNWSVSRKKYWTRICTNCDTEDKAIRHDKIRTSIKESSHRLKVEMIEAYGGKCVCCGDDHEPFLTIDHIDGRGGEHVIRVRKKNGGEKNAYRLGGTLLYRWLKKRGWPTDNYQLMCMNCNFAKSHNPGGCPHEIDRQRLIQTESVV